MSQSLEHIWRLAYYLPTNNNKEIKDMTDKNPNTLLQMTNQSDRIVLEGMMNMLYNISKDELIDACNALTSFTADYSQSSEKRRIAKKLATLLREEKKQY